MTDAVGETGTGAAAAPAPALQTESLESEPTIKWVSEGVIIAATPLAAYVIAFAYHAGYTNFFGIPSEFISLDLKMVLRAAVPMAFVAGLLYCMSGLFFGLWPESKRDHPMYWRLVGMFPGVFVVFTLLAINRFHWRKTLPPGLIGVAVVSVVFFLIPIFTRRDKKTFTERMAAYDDASDRIRFSILESVMRRGLRTLLMAALWLALAAQIAYSYGGRIAEDQAQYFVRSTSPETVVLAIYGDTLVTARFNRDKKTVERNIMIGKVTDTPTVAMRLEWVGPLRPDK